MRFTLLAGAERDAHAVRGTDVAAAFASLVLLGVEEAEAAKAELLDQQARKPNSSKSRQAPGRCSQQNKTMTPKQLQEARHRLGLTLHQMARLLGYDGEQARELIDLRRFS